MLIETYDPYWKVRLFRAHGDTLNVLGDFIHSCERLGIRAKRLNRREWNPNALDFALE